MSAALDRRRWNIAREVYVQLWRKVADDDDYDDEPLDNVRFKLKWLVVDNMLCCLRYISTLMS